MFVCVQGVLLLGLGDWITQSKFSRVMVGRWVGGRRLSLKGQQIITGFLVFPKSKTKKKKKKPFDIKTSSFGNNADQFSLSPLVWEGEEVVVTLLIIPNEMFCLFSILKEKKGGYDIVSFFPLLFSATSVLYPRRQRRRRVR